MQIKYEDGTLIFSNVADGSPIVGLQDVIYDRRTLEYRSPASLYRQVILELNKHKVSKNDYANNYKKLDLKLKKAITPRKHQTEALKAWLESGRVGVVSLPTGAGKTILAILAIQKVQRSTLILVPTIDLLNQWHTTISSFFNVEPGRLGGGYHEIKEITVSTYDSARLFIEKYGNRFAFLIADECHHLPTSQNILITKASIAPFRLGLSATVERTDSGEEILYETIGPKVYEGFIQDMVSKVLSPYDVHKIEVELNKSEKEKYDQARKVYLSFLKQARVNLGHPGGWQMFLIKASQSQAGKKVLEAYREQKKTAQYAENKLHRLWEILNSHSEDSAIVFTDENALAYKIGESFILPVITHKTKAAERKELLDKFRSGELKVLVTSKVLNEGVDVPEASVGIVMSGSGAVREHVQRLGRILRHKPGKRALLYEIIAINTSEKYVHERRRQHNAYQRST